MTILYNCRHSGYEYRITKFDHDMNVEASYLCTEDECECPAGHRPTCRHRQMLPKFLARNHVGDEWFLDYDRGGWVQMGDEWAQQEPTFLEKWTKVINEPASMERASQPSGESEPAVTPVSVAAVEPVLESLAPPSTGSSLPEGVTMIVLDNPEKVVEVHNAIAEAVGEPELRPRHIARRF